MNDVLDEADSLIRRRMKGRKVTHIILAVEDGVGVIRSNASPEVLLELAALLTNIAEQAAAAPASDDTTH
jgi:hypothetical protein